MKFKHSFSILSAERPFDGNALYVLDDFSLAFELSIEAVSELQQDCRATLVGSACQLEISLPSHYCLYVWGYGSLSLWQACDINVPEFRPGRLRIASDEPFLPGVAQCFDSSLSDDVHYDPASGWLRFGGAFPEGDFAAVEFAKGNIAVISDKHLTHLFVHVTNWVEVSKIIGAKS